MHRASLSVLAACGVLASLPAHTANKEHTAANICLAILYTTRMSTPWAFHLYTVGAHTIV